MPYAMREKIIPRTPTKAAYLRVSIRFTRTVGKDKIPQINTINY
jgi:hypothetical protein